MPIELEPLDGDLNQVSENLQALRKALIRIGVAEERPDGRVNVPDIYRIAARLMKRGGVPPLR